MALVLLIAILVVVTRVIPRSLRPLDDLARRAATIDAQSLNLRFPTAGLPSELAAIAARLNELLQRLSVSFQRERRFTADVAHELRTPIAELRSLAEVALAGPGDPKRDTVVLQDARDIALQMERLVTSLLALSRFQSGHQAVKPEPVDVAAAINRAWLPLEGVARQRRLQIDLGDGATGQVAADPALFDSVLRNLLENAATYTPEGGRVAISTALEGDTTTITVANTSGDLDETDRPHLFEPFWRKDAARTDGFHSGLGLALVEAMVRVMGGVVSASLTPDGWLRFVVRMPSES
jgi:two-component system sensor histidine kinase QseC